jgi:ectoine hydroxylase-related dioxygenase (phytanoyl-CoA dioxygenase family)
LERFVQENRNDYRQAFEKEGYLLGLQVLSNDEVAQYRKAYERLDDMVRERSPKGRITNMHHTDAEIWRLATHPRVLDIVDSIIGPDIVLISTGFFAKKPNTGDQFVAWHQDTMYWGLRPPFALTVWIAIDDSDVANGCMRVIPRTHHVGLLVCGPCTDATGPACSATVTIRSSGPTLPNISSGP